MRGGKRENAGRKGYGPSKSYWLPVAIEKDVLEILNRYKAEFDSVTESKPVFENVTESKAPVKPVFPILNPMQLKRFRDWLVTFNYIKSPTLARKQTATPKACQKTFMDFIHLAEDSETAAIMDIAELYFVD